MACALLQQQHAFSPNAKSRASEGLPLSAVHQPCMCQSNSALCWTRRPLACTRTRTRTHAAQTARGSARALAHAPAHTRLKQPEVLHAHRLRRAPRARLLGARQVGLRAQQHALVRARERAQARPEPGQRRERERGVRPGAEHERERGGERPAHAGGGRCGVSVVCEFCLF